MKIRTSLSLVAIAVALVACGGGSGSDSTSQPVAPLATGSTTLQADLSVPTATPSLQIAPITVTEPNASVAVAPHTESVTASAVSPSAVTPTVATIFTPAQIRAAYQLPALPSGTPTAAQLPQLGAGQTIYIVDAMHDGNAAAELTAFNTKFALPVCTTKTIPTNSALPLAAPSASSCDFSVVYATQAGGMTTAAPAYNASWAMEIALDVQWAHATAPLARIVLIEAPDASVTSLSAAVRLANAMGPGIVSMSFGAPEGSWTANYESTFTQPNMTYLAATGDNGAAVAWPSVSPSVLAVGGTSLSYTGSGTRTEISWSGTGGGMSVYTATPSYQTNLVPGLGTIAHRMVADVAFNADPYTGQYTVTIAPGSTATGWLSVGGTSLSTPQWAGIVAITNATRLQARKTVLGAPHTALYNQLSTAPATYSSVFADIKLGTDGTCATCAAKVGYDQLTGLGTPNVSNLVAALSGSTTTAPTPPATPAPVVNVQNVTGKVGTALTFTATSTASHAVTYTVTGMPSGMTFTTAGVGSWTAPVAGTYTLTVTATDTTTSQIGQGTVTIVIAAAPVATGPVLSVTSVTGTAGKLLTGKIVITDSNSASFGITISGIPSGMTFTIASGTITYTWTTPVKGNYALAMQVVDSKGASLKTSIPVTVN